MANVKENSAFPRFNHVRMNLSGFRLNYGALMTVQHVCVDVAMTKTAHRYKANFPGHMYGKLTHVPVLIVHTHTNQNKKQKKTTKATSFTHNTHACDTFSQKRSTFLNLGWHAYVLMILG